MTTTMKPEFKRNLDDLLFKQEIHFAQGGGHWSTKVPMTIRKVTYGRNESLLVPQPFAWHIEVARGIFGRDRDELRYTQEDFDSIMFEYGVHASGDLVGQRVIAHTTKHSDGLEVAALSVPEDIFHKRDLAYVKRTLEAKYGFA